MLEPNLAHRAADALVAGRADIARHAIPGLNITIHLDGIIRLLKEAANYCATAFTAEQASEPQAVTFAS